LAERFPRAALNPSAQPWVREVQRRIEEVEKAALMGGQRAANGARVLDGLRGKENADGAIYRRNGVVVPVGSEDFTVYAGATEDQGGQYDESGQFIQDGSFASLNVQPSIVAMRQYDVLRDLYGYVRLTAKSFDASWGRAQNVTISHDGSLLDDAPVHWAIQWEFEAPGSTYDEDGLPVTTRLQGSLFDGAIGVVAHQDWTPDGAGGAQPGPVVYDGIYLGGALYEGGGGGSPVSPATTEAAGIVELATDAEAIAGTDATRAVTPHGLGAALAGARNLADAWRGEWVQP
jgi:hypothetical protein